MVDADQPEMVGFQEPTFIWQASQYHKEARQNRQSKEKNRIGVLQSRGMDRIEAQV